MKLNQLFLFTPFFNITSLSIKELLFPFEYYIGLKLLLIFSFTNIATRFAKALFLTYSSSNVLRTEESFTIKL